MIVVIAVLVAFAVAVALTTLLVGKPTRRPGPRPGSGVVETASPRHRFPIPRRRRSARAIDPSALAAWADDLARALRHGSTLHAALTNTSPTDAAIEQRSASLRHWLGRGATVAEACDEWSAELSGDAHATSRGLGGSNDRLELLATMSAVLAAAASLGGSAAAPLDRLAVTMRQRASDDLERAAQSAQAQMSAKVLTSVPLAVLALLLATDADVRGAVASAAGGSAVAFGLALNTLGAFWMRRIAVSSGGASS